MQNNWSETFSIGQDLICSTVTVSLRKKCIDTIDLPKTTSRPLQQSRGGIQEVVKMPWAYWACW